MVLGLLGMLMLLFGSLCANSLLLFWTCMCVFLVLILSSFALRLLSRTEEADEIHGTIRNCPACGGQYRLSEFNLQAAEHIFCSTCKAELPKT